MRRRIIGKILFFRKTSLCCEVHTGDSNTDVGKFGHEGVIMAIKVDEGGLARAHSIDEGARPTSELVQTQRLG